MGEVIVVRMNGYQPQRLSDFDIERRINAYSRVDDATSLSYMLGGHAMYQINFPTAGESWLYDGASQAWSQLKSYGGTRHRAEFGALYAKKQYVFDYETGLIYRLDPESVTDNGRPIEFEIVTKHVFKGDSTTTINRIAVNGETGSQTDNSNPQIMLQVSKDGGHTWGQEIWTSYGKTGEYKTRAQWRRLGRAREWTFKFRITDAVKRVLIDGELETEAGIS